MTNDSELIAEIFEGAVPQVPVRVTRNGRRLPEAPVEAAYTGPARRGLKGAKAGAQVDTKVQRLGVGWDSYLKPKTRSYGRGDNVLEVIRAIRDLDPVAGQAVWNYLRLLNPGHELQAMVTNAAGEESPEDGPAQEYLDGLARRVGAEYGGGLDQLHNVLALSLLTSGAVAAECAPTAGLNDVEDWYAVEPSLLRFQRDSETGILLLGQEKADGTFDPLPMDQVFYQPLDPDVGDPYGRPPMVGAIQAVMARSMMLNDLRAVAHNAGYPRIDVEVMWDVIRTAAPPQLTEDGKEADFSAWAEKQLNQIVTDYQTLQVDDTFVHYDWVKPSLMASSGLSFDFPALDGVLQRQLNSALKMLPILLGINEGTSETHGSVQWQIQIAGINALQRVLKRLIEKLANASLQIAGFPAIAKLTYDETRTVDRLYEAQSELFEAQNLQLDVTMGWRTNDEASELRTGHKAVAAPGDQMPKPAAPTTTGDQGGQQPSAQEKQQKPGDHAWELLWHTLSAGLGEGRTGAAPATEVWAKGERRLVELDGEELDHLAAAYSNQAEALFMAELQRLLETLAGEGIPVRGTSSGEIADSAFGLTYRREMKKLLRLSIEDGMRQAGMTENIAAPGKLVRNIWKENDQFVTKIRNELAAQVRSWQAAAKAGKAVTLEDVKDWFGQNSYRQAMMGSFLAKQGIAAGFTYGNEMRTPMSVFRWKLGPVKTEHCGSCLARADQCYTTSDLQRIGYPGSLQLECVSNCKCSIVAEECGKAEKPSRAVRVVEWIAPEQGKGEACSIRREEDAAGPVGTNASTGSPDSQRAFEEQRRMLEMRQPTDDEGRAIYLYATTEAGKINEALRAGRLPRMFSGPQAVEQIDAYLDAAPRLERDVVVHRGWGGLDEVFGGRVPAPGEVFREPGYCSASTGVIDEGIFATDVRATIRVPAGSDARMFAMQNAMKGNVAFADEAGYDLARESDPYQEMLLDRGLLLRVDGVQKVGQIVNLTLSVIGRRR